MIISFRAARESQGRKKGLVKIFRAVSPEVKGGIDGCILDSDSIIRDIIES
jgi:hypothetical protein